MTNLTRKQRLQRGIRNAIISRNTLEAMANNNGYMSAFGKKYLNEMAVVTMNLARNTHQLLPYYLATRTI